MLTYENPRQSCDPTKVRLEGRIVGFIRSTFPGEYFYQTKGGHQGERFFSIEEVKQSLQGEIT